MKRGSGSFLRAVRWAVPAAVFLAGCGGAPVAPGAVAPAPGFVKGTLVADNILSVPLAGSRVTLGDAETTASQDGSFSLPRVAPGKYSLLAENRYPAGDVRRVLGLAMVYVGENPMEVRVRMRDATDVDRFCSDCHPSGKNVTRRDQIPRDVHPSGVVPVKARKQTGRYDDRGRVTCESCHAVHAPTPYPHYLRASFRDGRLCLECH